ncbi:MAG: hypothetical protein ACE5GS_10525 [Kiloniellaceae bacterium]
MTEIRSLHGTTVAEIFSSGLDNLDQIDAVAGPRGVADVLHPLWRSASSSAQENS